MVNIAHEIECSKGGKSVNKISLWIFLEMSQPVGRQYPVSAGVPVIQRGRLCPEAKQVARVANCEVGTEARLTAMASKRANCFYGILMFNFLREGRRRFFLFFG